MNLNRLSRFSRAINGTGRESSAAGNRECEESVCRVLWIGQSCSRAKWSLPGVHNGSDGLFVKVTKFSGLKGSDRFIRQMTFGI